MSEDLINSKIELLEDQIANLEQSGFFTEKEIDKLSGPLRLELDTLRNLIESSGIVTGNDFPAEEPLIISMIWNEIAKNNLNEEEMKLFDELKELMSKGVSIINTEHYTGLKRVLDRSSPEANFIVTSNYKGE